jgi:hypothetical protein
LAYKNIYISQTTVQIFRYKLRHFYFFALDFGIFPYSKCKQANQTSMLIFGTYCYTNIQNFIKIHKDPMNIKSARSLSIPSIFKCKYWWHRSEIEYKNSTNRCAMTESIYFCFCIVLLAPI